jgi:hypothetical protein
MRCLCGYAGQMGGAGGVGGGGAPGVMRQQSMPQNMAAGSGRGAWDQQQQQQQQWGAGGMRSAGGGQMTPQQGQFGQGGQRQWNSAGPNNNNRPNNMPGAPGLQQPQQGMRLMQWNTFLLKIYFNFIEYVNLFVIVN